MEMSPTVTVKRLLLAGTVSAFILWFAFHGWFYLAGAAQKTLLPVALPSGLWQAVQGDGEIVDNRLALTERGRMGWGTMAAELSVPLPLNEYEAIRLRVADRAGAMRLEVGLAPPGNLAAFASASVSVGQDGWVEFPLERIFFFFSEIGYVLV